MVPVDFPTVEGFQLTHMATAWKGRGPCLAGRPKNDRVLKPVSARGGLRGGGGRISWLQELAVREERGVAVLG